MATLTMENVTKKFGRRVIAVNNLTLEVQDREFLVLLGPSGCGKTTAMRIRVNQNPCIFSDYPSSRVSRAGCRGHVYFPGSLE